MLLFVCFFVLTGFCFSSVSILKILLVLLLPRFLMRSLVYLLSHPTIRNVSFSRWLPSSHLLYFIYSGLNIKCLVWSYDIYSTSCSLIFLDWFAYLSIILENFLQIFLLPHSLSFPSGIPTMPLLYHLILSHSSCMLYGVWLLNPPTLCTFCFNLCYLLPSLQVH